MNKGRILLIGLTLLALAGCGGGHPRGVPSRFDDSEPFSWRGHAPDDYEVHGIDISRYQSSVNWPQAAASGVAFAFIKATEGGDIADPGFHDHWSGAARAGVPRGAYHFYYHCRTGAEQAAWFLQNVPPQPGTLPPVLDIEWTQSRNCPRRPDPASIRAEAATFLQIVGQAWGKRPIIYTTVDYWQDNEMWKLGAYPFWLRSVAGHPQAVYDGHPWTFWQWTGTGRVAGIAGDVDLNAFAGSQADWQSWLAASLY